MLAIAVLLLQLLVVIVASMRCAIVVAIVVVAAIEVEVEVEVVRDLVVKVVVVVFPMLDVEVEEVANRLDRGLKRYVKRKIYHAHAPRSSVTYLGARHWAVAVFSRSSTRSYWRSDSASRARPRRASYARVLSSPARTRCPSPVNRYGRRRSVAGNLSRSESSSRRSSAPYSDPGPRCTPANARTSIMIA